MDLFGSDDEEENEEAAKLREERLAAYNAKKSKSMYYIKTKELMANLCNCDGNEGKQARAEFCNVLV